MERQRILTKSQKALIYLRMPGVLVGEFLIIFGIALSVAYVKSPYLIFLIFALLLLAGGAVLIIRVLDKLAAVSRIVEYGYEAVATLSDASTSLFSYNESYIRTFNFTYTVNGEEYRYQYVSRQYQNLNEQDPQVLLYLPDNPSTAIIPSFYSIEIGTTLMDE